MMYPLFFRSSLLTSNETNFFWGFLVCCDCSFLYRATVKRKTYREAVHSAGLVLSQTLENLDVRRILLCDDWYRVTQISGQKGLYDGLSSLHPWGETCFDFHSLRPVILHVVIVSTC